MKLSKTKKRITQYITSALITGNPDEHIITLEQYQYDEEKDWPEYTKYKLT